MLKTEDMQVREGSEAPAISQRDELVMKEMKDLDKLILALPAVLHFSKVQTLKRQADELQPRSAALMLALHLNRPPSEMVVSSSDLLTAIRQLAQLASKSRLSQNGQLTVKLLVDLAARLHADLIRMNAVA